MKNFKSRLIVASTRKLDDGFQFPKDKPLPHFRQLRSKVFPADEVSKSEKMEAVVNETVTPEDLMKFEKKYTAELAKGSVSKDSQFEYAWCLIRSKYSNDIAKGILLLEELVHKGTKDDQRDYLFYLAVANYRLKEYEKGLKYVRVLLKNEPSNTQGLELEKLIKKAMQKDGLVGMAIVGGIGLGVAGLAGLIGLAVAKSK